MRAALLLAAAVAALSVPDPARAEDAPPELLTAALQAMQVQRDQALNREVTVSAQLALARAEIDRLRREAAAAEPAARPPGAPETK